MTQQRSPKTLRGWMSARKRIWESMKGWRPSSTMADRSRSLEPRFCDDGLRCPGHPDWAPHEPRRRVREAVCAGAYAWTAFLVGEKVVTVDVLCRQV